MKTLERWVSGYQTMKAMNVPDVQCCLMIMICLCKLYELLPNLRMFLNTMFLPRKRVRDSQLPFHAKRCRKLWSPMVRSLGPDDFKRHHRISPELFNKIFQKIEHRIYTNPKFVRKTCCRGKVSAVDARSRLSMFLKHLAGSKIQDIERTHGVSRSTVTASIQSTMNAIIKDCTSHSSLLFNHFFMFE